MVAIGKVNILHFINWLNFNVELNGYLMNPCQTNLGTWLQKQLELYCELPRNKTFRSWTNTGQREEIGTGMFSESLSGHYLHFTRSLITQKNILTWTSLPTETPNEHFPETKQCWKAVEGGRAGGHMCINMWRKPGKNEFDSSPTGTRLGTIFFSAFWDSSGVQDLPWVVGHLSWAAGSHNFLILGLHNTVLIRSAELRLN